MNYKKIFKINKKKKINLFITKLLYIIYFNEYKHFKFKLYIKNQIFLYKYYKLKYNL